MNQQRFSEFAETQEQLIRVAGLIPDGTGGYENVITDDRYLPTHSEFANKMGIDDFSPFLTHIAQEVIALDLANQDSFKDKSAIVNAIYGEIFPRLITLEKALGVDNHPDVTTPGKPRPAVTWEHEVWNADGLTVYFSTNDLGWNDLAADKFDIAATGLPHNPNVLTGGIGYAQINWGTPRTVVRVYKTDLKGYRDDLSTELKIALFSLYWLNNVPWMG